MNPEIIATLQNILGLIFSAPVILTVGGLLIALWVPGRLRKLGFQPNRRDSELDWAGIIGLLLGVLAVMMGLSALASTASLPAVSKLIGTLFRTMLSLVPALAILAGAGHAIAARRRAALSRAEEEGAREEGRWIQRGAMLLAALTLIEMSLSLPAIVLIGGAIGLWLYRNPAIRKRMEEAWANLKAGQALREQQVTEGAAVGEMQLAGPVGLFDTRVEGATEPVPNTELLSLRS